MNPFNLPLQRLGVPAPLQVYLSAETLIAWQETAHLTRWVRHRAAQRLLRVRQRRLEVRQAAKHYVQRMRKQGQAQTTRLWEQTRIQAIQETVQWLVPVQQLESALANHLAQQAAQWAVDALKQLVDEVDQSRLLVKRLRASIRELQAHGMLTLWVHPNQVKSVQQTLAENSGIRVVANRQLTPLQAVLESPLVVINLDIEKHLTLLIKQLLSLPPLTMDSVPEENTPPVEASTPPQLSVQEGQNEQH